MCLCAKARPAANRRKIDSRNGSGIVAWQSCNSQPLAHSTVTSITAAKSRQGFESLINEIRRRSTPMPTTIAEVRDFLDHRRIALVGVSRNPTDFSRMLFREMCNQGYDMVPVNPAVGELESKRCFSRVQDIDPPVEGALVMTAPRDTERVVRDCAEAGIRRVWMHRGGGQGAVSKEAADFCREKGIGLVEGYCPFMSLPGTPFFHRIHGLILKLAGGYPRGVQRRAHLAGQFQLAIGRP